MDTLEHGSTSVAPLGSPVHWHFRALPREAQRGTIRRLALSGLNEEQIAASTGLSVESVRRAISEDDCLRHLPHPQNWTSKLSAAPCGIGATASETTLASSPRKVSLKKEPMKFPKAMPNSVSEG
jgi:hypothetical protein